MTDTMTPQQRHRCMSSIRSRDTRPEKLVRAFLWQHGWRYRLYRRDLPGRPDIVIARLHTAIFINGCFWHGHSCHNRMPKTNAQFWQEKIERNRLRDQAARLKLIAMGWNVITLWECELQKRTREATLQRLLHTLNALNSAPKAPSPYSYPEADTQLAADIEAEY